MATYLNGIDDYIPQVQLFEPDLNTYSKIINERQSRYDEARKQISNVYSSMLNSPMLRESDNETRDRYFKIIDDDIKKLSGMDLSLRQNQNAAANVFTQLLNDKNIAHDMVYTRQAQNALKTGENLKVSDPKSYWEGMTQLIQMDMMDYSSSDDEKALTMSAPKYTKRVNIMDEIIPMLDKLDLNIVKETASVPVIGKDGKPKLNADGTPQMQEGKWIVRQKNGQLAEPYTQALIQGMYADRGDVLDYYKEVARYERMKFAHQHADEFGGDVNEASKAYIQATMNGLREDMEMNRRMLEQVYGNATDKYKSDYGLEPWEEKSRIGEAEKFLDEIGAIDTARQQASSNISLFDNIVENMPASYFDGLVASSLMNAQISQAAQIVSARNSEITMKVNPYMQDMFNHQYRMSEKAYEYQLRDKFEENQNKRRIDLEDAKSQFRSREEAYKNLLKGETNKGLNYDGSKVVQVDPDTGMISDIEVEAGSPEAARLVYGDIMSTMGKALRQNGFVENETLLLNKYIDDIKKRANQQNGSYDARAEYVDMYSRYLYATGQGEKWEELVDKYNNNINNIYSEIQGSKIDFGTAGVNPLDIHTAYNKVKDSQFIDNGTKLSYRENIMQVDAMSKAYDKSFDDMKNNFISIASRMPADEQRAMKALFGLRPNQSFDNFTGQMASFEEFMQAGGYDYDEAIKLYDPTAESKKSIQFKFAKEMSNTPIDPYTSVLTGMHGYGSSYAHGLVVEYDNSNTNGWNYDLNRLVASALGYLGSGGAYVVNGYGGEEIPNQSDEAATQVLNNIYSAMSVTKKDASNAMTALIKSIAMNDRGYAAITFNVPSSMKGGVDTDSKNDVNNITLVLDKSKFRASKIISGIEDTPLMSILKLAGEYDIPMSSYTNSYVPNDPLRLVVTNRGIEFAGKINYAFQNADGTYTPRIVDISTVPGVTPESFFKCDGMVKSLEERLLKTNELLLTQNGQQ